MKKLRYIALALLIVLLVPTFASCHGSRGLDPFVMPEALNAEKEYEITFWAKNDTNVTQTRIYQKAIDDFEALYPNIKIKLKNITMLLSKKL